MKTTFGSFAAFSAERGSGRGSPALLRSAFAASSGSPPLPQAARAAARTASESAMAASRRRIGYPAAG